ncbi:hypothetical protein EUX98_g9756 [Antrodiella citrinella]|uniref:N-acetyltransferase domain-containing protein n=1 Tax=Antrodiella citrinella TaxID=2447956 RepID=A0A4S4LM02_9APHY|nr:hypothetical protein EUX98_g9756 [Antrodiella citrinella]
MTPVAAYDPNFCYPVKELESARVKLVPFFPSQHAEAFFAGTREYPEIYEFLPWKPFASIREVLKTAEDIRSNRNEILFAILDKATVSGGGRPSFAGIIGLLNTSQPNLSTEIGFLIIFPAMWGRSIASAATQSLLHWTLDPPSDGGLGMRRVQWQANELNVPSVRVAESIGFRLEGTTRWQRVVVEGKPGPTKPGEDKRPGRHSMIFAYCWDDWEDGGGGKFLQGINRV